MTKKTPQNGNAAAERAALRNRIKSFYRHLNGHAFDKCWSFLDPDLRQKGRVEEDKYAKSLSEFLDHYGAVEIVSMTIDLYPGVKTHERTQDCAYPLIVWKDAKRVAHLFRERWVKDGKTWYTRVVGLVTPEGDGTTEPDPQSKSRPRRRGDQ